MLYTLGVCLYIRLYSLFIVYNYYIIKYNDYISIKIMCALCDSELSTIHNTST